MLSKFQIHKHFFAILNFVCKINIISLLQKIKKMYNSVSAMMYSDFPYRPPPPSYQASMQEYRLRLLLLDRQSGIPATSGPSLQQVAAQAATEPPPNYRAHLR